METFHVRYCSAKFVQDRIVDGAKCQVVVAVLDWGLGVGELLCGNAVEYLFVITTKEVFHHYFHAQFVIDNVAVCEN